MRSCPDGRDPAFEGQMPADLSEDDVSVKYITPALYQESA